MSKTHSLFFSSTCNRNNTDGWAFQLENSLKMTSERQNGCDFFNIEKLLLKITIFDSLITLYSMARWVYFYFVILYQSIYVYTYLP